MGRCSDNPRTKRPLEGQRELERLYETRERLAVREFVDSRFLFHCSAGAAAVSPCASFLVAVASKKSPAKKRANRRKPERLLLTAGAVAPRPVLAIPTRYVNAVIGFFLLGPAVVLTKTFFDAFTHATFERHFWRTEEFWFFGLGAVLWTLWFCGSIWALGEPRPLRVYVFGHELTHAIWVWMMGGRVKKFHYSRDGGYILTDKQNFWIALSPYFYPVYSIALIAAYGVAGIFYDFRARDESFLWVTPMQWLLMALGVTWAFHLTFTCWMIPKGQSDLTTHGTFFSLVVIYVMNLLVLSALLVVAAPGVSCHSFANRLLENAEDFAQGVWNTAAGFARLMKSF